MLPKSFDELIRSAELPVLVDFYADWCGPCKMLAPVIKQISWSFKGRLMVVKIDIDKKPQVAAKHQVTAVPTLVLFARGREVQRIQGALPFAELSQRIEPYL